MEQRLSEIDKWSHLENLKWAHELNQVLGADNLRAVKQWHETNKILTENSSRHDREE